MDGSDSVCIFLWKQVGNNIVLVEKGLESIIEASLRVDDGLHEKLREKATVHKSFKEKYTPPSNIRTFMKQKETSESAPTTSSVFRSLEEKFDFKNDCFICGKPAVVDSKYPLHLRKLAHFVSTLKIRDSNIHIIAKCNEQCDDLGERVKCRLLNVSDLVAPEARPTATLTTLTHGSWPTHQGVRHYKDCREDRSIDTHMPPTGLRPTPTSLPKPPETMEGNENLAVQMNENVTVQMNAPHIIINNPNTSTLTSLASTQIPSAPPSPSDALEDADSSLIVESYGVQTIDESVVMHHQDVDIESVAQKSNHLISADPMLAANGSPDITNSDTESEKQTSDDHLDHAQN
ncbi:hypothetical protein AVEN_153096-1 [Araneus ventricosus]|uniref:Uncharacterized protein n=1 Tax=Araneus ventricosus TaxID=182803 RepID=A0A4Y2K462_ARAVE|nr:hypothetical protein AVEN_153096-1 [Araneus ventricosus]